MRLLIVRHAVAVPRGTPGLPDPDRPLTPEGEKKFKKAARGLARILDRPDEILTSPWRRALRTAEIAAEAWGKLAPKQTEALAGGSFEGLTAVLESYPPNARLAVVGHEPWLSALLARLLGTPEAERLQFKKGGVALVEVEGRLADGGQLLLFLSPKVLRALAD